MTISQYFPYVSRRSLLLVVLILGCNLIFSTQVSAASLESTTSNSVSCQAINVPNLALGDGQPAQYTIYGQLCQPNNPTDVTRSHTIQLLLSGSTYSHLYWDWPSTPDHPSWSSDYSAVRYLTDDGYNTFNIDRIGIGQSSHPLSNLVDIPSNAYVVHELVGLLRNGAIGGVSFSRVILIGHSMGSLVAMIEANTYQDVDGLILTSELHKMSPTGISKIQTIPANQDPSGRFANLDSGYVTTVPNTRAAPFYYTATSDPAVIQYDEQTKETSTLAEISGLTNVQSGQITVPVLLIVGQQDVINCASDAVDCSSSSTIYQEEAPYYTPQAHLQVVLILNTGHDLNLHTTAHQTYDAMVNWLANQDG